MGHKHSFNTDITDGDELNEIEKVEKILNSEEKVLLVARESRLMPGGSILTPNTVIATDKRVIIRDPYMMGLKSELIDIPYDVITSVKLQKGIFTSTILFKAPTMVNKSKLGLMDENISGEDDHGAVIEALPKDKAEELLEIIRRHMKVTGSGEATSSIDTISIADEIEKLSKLKQKGSLSESEFQKMKQELLQKK
ncbi:MAG TPA: PH domain-containing protein [Nitrososphaeraceae archaeon]|nr:PH domain-containing protein [Nitrososphaeraceae archaeon]